MLTRPSSSGWRSTSRTLLEFVQEKDAVMGQGDLARLRRRAPTYQPHVGNGVMGIAERPYGHECPAVFQQAADAEDLGRFDGLFKRHARQDGRYALGQHGLAGTRRPDHQYVMAARRGHFQRALGRLLSAHIAEVHREVLQLAEQRLRRHAIRLTLDHAHHRAVQQFQHIQQR